MSEPSYSATVTRLMFDWEELTPDVIQSQAQTLPRKLLRWLGANHPDNRTRKIFFRMTGVHIGKQCNITPGFIVNDGYSGLCRIGDRVSIATNVTIVVDSNPNNSRLQDHPYVKACLIKTAPVIIEDDVWLGTNVVVLPGVRIGQAAVIGAGAVVRHDIPAYSVAAGVPAVVIRHLHNSHLGPGAS